MPPTPAYSSTTYDDYDSLNRLKSIGRRQSTTADFVGESFDYDDGNQLSTVTYSVNLGNRPAPGDTGDVATIAKDFSKAAAAALEPDAVREPYALISAGTDAQTGHEVSYHNDAVRRLGKTETLNGAITVTEYTPNTLNQYTHVNSGLMGVPLPYDGNFNLSGFDGWTYVYDADNRLISATTQESPPSPGDPVHSATFIYDGLGRCVKRTIDGAQTVITYDDWKPIVEWSGLGEFVAWNLYGPGPDEILVRYQPSTAEAPGATAYLHYHLDGLGNVEFLLSANNLGLEKYSYDAFGMPTITDWDGDPVPNGTSPNGNRFLFTGREYIYTLGLYDYRHRMYQPKLGRFMQVDPIGFKGDAQNLYRYCGANPILHSDPTGLLDYQWLSALHGDSSNNEQGTLQEMLDRRIQQQAGPDGGGGGKSAPSQDKPKSVEAQSEGPKRAQIVGDNDIGREVKDIERRIKEDLAGRDLKKMTHTEQTTLIYKDTSYRLRGGEVDYRGSYAPHGIYKAYEFNYIGVGAGTAMAGWGNLHRAAAVLYHNLREYGRFPSEGKSLFAKAGYDYYLDHH